MKKKILYTIAIIFAWLILLSNNTYATSEGTEIKYNDNLIGTSKTIGIMLSKDNDNRCITKTELMTLDSNITNVSNTASGDLVKTGSTVTIGNETYYAILYGDANQDGYICDTDDIMVIINDYLGTGSCNLGERLAANLMNTDNVLDIDDIVIMMNMYLGNLSGNLVANLKDSNITIEVNPSQNPFVHNGRFKVTQALEYDYSVSFDFAEYARGNPFTISCNNLTNKEIWIERNDGPCEWITLLNSEFESFAGEVHAGFDWDGYEYGGELEGSFCKCDGCGHVDGDSGFTKIYYHIPKLYNVSSAEVIFWYGGKPFTVGDMFYSLLTDNEV